MSNYVHKLNIQLIIFLFIFKDFINWKQIFANKSFLYELEALLDDTNYVYTLVIKLKIAEK